MERPGAGSLTDMRTQRKVRHIRQQWMRITLRACRGRHRHKLVWRACLACLSTKCGLHLIVSARATRSVLTLDLITTKPMARRLPPPLADPLVPHGCHGISRKTHVLASPVPALVCNRNLFVTRCIVLYCLPLCVRRHHPSIRLRAI